VPKDGSATNFHHRLRLDLGFFGKAGAQTPAENYNLHKETIRVELYYKESWSFRNKPPSLKN
jgi:hypothetical protein